MIDSSICTTVYSNVIITQIYSFEEMDYRELDSGYRITENNEIRDTENNEPRLLES